MSAMRAAMIDAIREAPNDDAPRLICADWLEEQGGEANVARAEFIRTQIQRANLASNDIRHSALQARELRLLKRWALVWCGSHFVFKKVRFRRGFIEYVHLHLRHFLHHRRQMLALEPVRDVNLTGWFRAPTDLIRRVAGCEEWKYVETLRIHHQGPHKDPRSNVVELLESPHLSRLRALHCTQVVFDVDARRRFERLPILRKLTELYFPTLDTLVAHPGEWYSDAETVFAHDWEELKSLTLSYSFNLDFLRRLTEMPFWNRLTSIRLHFSWQMPEILAILGDRWPQGLQEVYIDAGYGCDANAGPDGFFERLADSPLRSLHLQSLPLSASQLSRLLGGDGRNQLRELSLCRCELTAEHARILADAPELLSLRFLSLSVNHQIDAEAAKILFSSEYLRGVTHLDLSGMRMGSEGLKALAQAKCWERLRSISLSSTAFDEDALRELLQSPNLHHLNWLSLGNENVSGSPQLNISPETAAAITRLPNLASLRLSLRHCDRRSKQILTDSDSLAWVSIFGEDQTYDIGEYRAYSAPERWPPLDSSPEQSVEV